MKIIQLTNKTRSQTMGYVFRAASGQVLVVDGGHFGNDAELERLIQQAGGHVDLWLITHPHADHYGAVIELLQRDTQVTWERMGASFLPDAWAADFDDGWELIRWNAFAATLGDRLFEWKPGQRFSLGTMAVEVLTGTNPDLVDNPLNDQSCVLRITEGDFSIIMLGDLGWDGGKRLLETGIDLKATAVQMAHHGQRGVEEPVYRAIAPQYAFWPTPLWLWVNSHSRKLIPGSASFETPKNIAWMEALGAVNIVSFDRSVVFDTETREFGPC